MSTLDAAWREYNGAQVAWEQCAAASTKALKKRTRTEAAPALQQESAALHRLEEARRALGRARQ